MAYFAGILDGEGSIVIDHDRHRNGKRYHALRVNIVNSDIGLLLWINQRWPGTISPKSDVRPGKLPIHALSWNGTKAAKILEIILPFLIVKKQQAMLAVEFIKTGPGKGHPLPEKVVAIRDAYRLEIRKLNRRDDQRGIA